mgnify:CR=1 FL=1
MQEALKMVEELKLEEEAIDIYLNGIKNVDMS